MTKALAWAKGFGFSLFWAKPKPSMGQHSWPGLFRPGLGHWARPDTYYRGHTSCFLLLSAFTASCCVSMLLYVNSRTPFFLPLLPCFHAPICKLKDTLLAAFTASCRVSMLLYVNSRMPFLLPLLPFVAPLVVVPAPRAMSTPMPMVLACPLAPFMAAFMRLARDVCVDGYHGTSLCFADTLYTLFWPGQHIFCVHLSILPRFDEVWNLVLG
jgi:hypothetical protein